MEKQNCNGIWGVSFRSGWIQGLQSCQWTSLFSAGLPTCNAGDLGLIPGSGRSPGGGRDNPLQYSCLENPVDRGAWWATVHMGLQRVGHD